MACKRARFGRCLEEYFTITVLLNPGIPNICRMKTLFTLLGGLVLAGLCSWPVTPAAAALPTNAILFVTQVQLPDERNDNLVANVAVSVVSALGNHLADTAQ